MQKIRQSLIHEAWAMRYGIRKGSKQYRWMTSNIIRQLSECKSEEARRLILGIKESV